MSTTVNMTSLFLYCQMKILDDVLSVEKVIAEDIQIEAVSILPDFLSRISNANEKRLKTAQHFLNKLR